MESQELAAGNVLISGVRKTVLGGSRGFCAALGWASVEVEVLGLVACVATCEPAPSHLEASCPESCG